MQRTARCIGSSVYDALKGGVTELDAARGPQEYMETVSTLLYELARL